MNNPQLTTAKAESVRVRPLQGADLPEAERIFHLAFGTFLGLPDPMQFWPDRRYIRSRYLADPEGAFAAVANNELIGSNFATNWGSVGFFGPLTVRPDYWDCGIAQRLLEPAMQLFEKWQTRHVGLFTFPHSPKHVYLYQKFGFWQRFLTALMRAPVRSLEPAIPQATYSDLNAGQQTECLQACRELTHTIYDGLDVQREIRAVANQSLGDTVLLLSGSRLNGFAVCHCGANTEAGNETCYVKFGAARRAASFDQLLDACHAFALQRGLTQLAAGVNLSRHDAYQRMLARGFQTERQGVTMHRPNEPASSRPDVYVMDDWR